MWHSTHLVTPNQAIPLWREPLDTRTSKYPVAVVPAPHLNRPGRDTHRTILRMVQTFRSAARTIESDLQRNLYRIPLP